MEIVKKKKKKLNSKTSVRRSVTQSPLRNDEHTRSEFMWNENDDEQQQARKRCVYRLEKYDKESDFSNVRISWFFRSFNVASFFFKNEFIEKK